MRRRKESGGPFLDSLSAKAKLDERQIYVDCDAIAYRTRRSLLKKYEDETQEYPVKKKYSTERNENKQRRRSTRRREGPPLLVRGETDQFTETDRIVMMSFPQREAIAKTQSLSSISSSKKAMEQR
ncbi:hypothetical protein TSAR_016790 [Trichomalopsis sarcophagae]|uniref:Uncharacterized protein n=1 Tax=Trichomalopsis sarcophagae TaxID=543379 RepID=A0A232EWP6_9HYME|nr:hypothetical protein TSAR_016790 [Trichomalopsis sarcophagae]